MPWQNVQVIYKCLTFKHVIKHSLQRSAAICTAYNEMSILTCSLLSASLWHLYGGIRLVVKRPCCQFTQHMNASVTTKLLHVAMGHICHKELWVPWLSDRDYRGCWVLQITTKLLRISKLIELFLMSILFHNVPIIRPMSFV